MSIMLLMISCINTSAVVNDNKNSNGNKEKESREGLPDLIITKTEPCFYEGCLYYIATVKNIGGETAHKSVDVNLEIKNFRFKTIYSNQAGASRTYGLKPGRSVEVSLIIPSNYFGFYLFVMTADQENNIIESDETNNKKIEIVAMAFNWVAPLKNNMNQR